MESDDKLNKFNEIIDLDLTKNINDIINQEYIKNFFNYYYYLDWNMNNAFIKYYESNKEEKKEIHVYLTLYGMNKKLVFKYPEYLVELTLAGLGFITIGWAFNALKGRV